MATIAEINKDILKAKKMVSEVELYIGKREGETEFVNKLINAENLLTYCLSRLENAILPPCKVGDTVYVLSKDKKEILGYRIISVILYDGVPTLYSAEYRENNVKFYVEDFTEFNIGETVFLTRGDAERKLQREIMFRQQRLHFYSPLERLKRIEEELSSAEDNSIFEIFEKYGYSQEQILSLLKENKITRFINRSCDGEVWQYIVDDNFYLNVELDIIEEPPCGFRMIFRELSAGKVGEANE